MTTVKQTLQKRLDDIQWNIDYHTKTLEAFVREDEALREAIEMMPDEPTN